LIPCLRLTINEMSQFIIDGIKFSGDMSVHIKMNGVRLIILSYNIKNVINILYNISKILLF